MEKRSVSRARGPRKRGGCKSPMARNSRRRTTALYPRRKTFVIGLAARIIFQWTACRRLSPRECIGAPVSTYRGYTGFRSRACARRDRSAAANTQAPVMTRRSVAVAQPYYGTRTSRIHRHAHCRNAESGYPTHHGRSAYTMARLKTRPSLLYW
jgi:hypothetical protein